MRDAPACASKFERTIEEDDACDIERLLGTILNGVPELERTRGKSLGVQLLVHAVVLGLILARGERASVGLKKTPAAMEAQAGAQVDREQVFFD